MAKASKKSAFDTWLEDERKSQMAAIAKCKTLIEVDNLERNIRMRVRITWMTKCTKEQRTRIEDMIIDLIQLCIHKALEISQRDYAKNRERDNLNWREEKRRELRALEN